MPSRPVFRSEWLRFALAISLTFSPVPGTLAQTAATASPTAAAASEYSGRTLREALERLRREGFDVVYSSTLVTDSLTVRSDPGSGSLQQRANRLLAEHQLELITIRPGRFAVARQRVFTAAEPVDAAVATAAAQGLEEVAVFASRYRIAAFDDLAPSSLTRQQVEALPGIGEDVLRVTRYLPGTATNGLSARSNVRGGRDNELAVYFDDVPLYEPFHYKDFQALLGVLDPSAVSRLDFYSGVFPAEFGDRLSGVLDISPRLPTAGMSEHELGISLLYAHALSVGEHRVRDRPVRWLASVRQSTAELAIRAAERGGIEPQFFDLLLRAEWSPGDNDTLTAGLIWLDDELAVQSGGGAERTRASYRDRTGWMKWQHEFESQSLQLLLANSERHTDRGGSLERVGDVDGSVREDRESGATRFELQWHHPDEAGAWSAGAALDRYSVEFDYAANAAFEPTLAALFARSAQLQRAADIDARGDAWSAWVTRLWAPAERWSFNLGLRFDAQRYAARDALTSNAAPSRLSAQQWSPRLAAEYRWSERTVLRASVGRATQAERPDELMVADGDSRFHGPQRADQLVLGIEHRLGEHAQVRIEAYRKDVADPLPRYENLFDSVTVLPELEVDRRRVEPLASRLYGVEGSLRWQAGEPWSGWLGYTWSEAKDQFDGFSAPRSWNQLHSVFAGLSWSRQPWQLSANLLGHSGWRRNSFESTTTAGGGAGLRLAQRNSASWRPFVSLDLRAAWRRPLRRGAVRVYGEIINAANRSNPCCEQIAVSAGGELFSEQRNWLPRYALIGAAWELP